MIHKNAALGIRLISGEHLSSVHPKRQIEILARCLKFLNVIKNAQVTSQPFSLNAPQFRSRYLSYMFGKLVYSKA